MSKNYRMAIVLSLVWAIGVYMFNPGWHFEEGEMVGAGLPMFITLARFFINK